MSLEDGQSGVRVLIVDDDTELLTSFRDLLTAKGFTVSIAEDGAKAMALMNASEFDVVLCDLMMPNMTGDQLYDKVKEVKPGLAKRFVFITGYEKEPRFAQFLRRESAQILTKPVTSMQLIQKIETVTQSA